MYLFIIIWFISSEKSGAAPVPAAPTQPQAAKKLDNLFFIEEPKSIHTVESKLQFSIKQCTHAMLDFMTSHHILDYRGHSYLHC